MNTLQRIQCFSFLVLSLLLSGCVADSVFFHERTQFGLNVEARPELNTPVNLNMAYNRNLVAIVPSKNEEGGSKQSSDDEAVSLLSTFGMDYKQGRVLFIGSELYIHNHFATGEAAKSLTNNSLGNPAETKKVIKSIVSGTK